MKSAIIIRWCEIHLKGKNRKYFEKLLEDNIKIALKGIDYKFVKITGRYLIEDFLDFSKDEIISRLKKVSGIHTLSVASVVKTNVDDIVEIAKSLTESRKGTFKVETRRADKSFAMPSLQFSAFIGGKVLQNNKNLSVDVHEPSFILYVDIRESKDTLIYTDVIKMMGGMPNGSSGRGMLMISGGIDSPVAGYMMAKRGMKLDAIHFHSYPYTSELAKEKVITLAKMVGEYTGGINLYIVPFTEIQEEIHKKCPEEFMITMMRRFMMRISEKIAYKTHAQAIITGESLGQVASQTIESITSSNSVVSIPVLRPLIAMDKLEIVKISEDIGTFETSILPYEDCCTVFLPKFPAIKPNLKVVQESEKALEVDLLIEKAIQNIEKITL